MKNKLKDGWEPAWKTKKRTLAKPYELPYHPELTNKRRMELRKRARREAKEIIERMHDERN